MIQIIRLKNGEDIIGEVLTDTGDYEIQEPMSVSIEYRGNQSGLVMNHWLPIGVMDGNSVVVPLEEVLCFMDPNTRFLEFYQEMVAKLNSSLDGIKDEDMELMAEAMDELENTKGISIH